MMSSSCRPGPIKWLSAVSTLLEGSYPRNQVFYDLGRKTMRKDGKGMFENNSRHFPMAGGGVFAGRGEAAFAVRARRMVDRRKPRERFDSRKA